MAVSFGEPPLLFAIDHSTTDSNIHQLEKTLWILDVTQRAPVAWSFVVVALTGKHFAFMVLDGEPKRHSNDSNPNRMKRNSQGGKPYHEPEREEADGRVTPPTAAHFEL